MGWWRPAQQSKGNDKKCNEAKRSRLLLQALEPRLMFDGAAASTVAAAAHVDIPHPAERSAPESQAPDRTHPAAESVTEKMPALLETAAATKQVVFIESNVSNYQSLIAQLPAGMEVLILDASKDGLSQIAAWAETHHGYAAMHIISHGESADLMLGSNELTTAGLSSRQADLKTIGQSLQPGGDILLYGCDIAAGSSGAAFVTALSRYTHADVAASIDATGAASLGGNWTLERSSGHIDVATLDLSHYNGLLTRPTSGTTTFDSQDGSTTVVPTGVSSLTVSNVLGWNFTMQMNSNSDGQNEMIIIEKDGSSSVETVDALSDGTKQITYFSVKPNDSSLFTLNSIGVVLNGYDSTFSGGSVQLVGYLNGSAVSGATLTQTVSDIDNSGSLVTFNVSSNSNFQGIDSFRVLAANGHNITGLLGIGAINATNFHFPGPTLTSSGGSSAYSGGTGSAVAVDSGITLSDTAASTQTSATVSITGNFHSSEDVLAFSNTNATTYGNIVSSYNSGTGVLTLTSSGSTATNAQWQSALEAVTYRDSSLSPNTSSRTISFAITDASSNTSSTVTKTITVAADAAPVISNLNGDSNTYYAGGGAVHLDTGSAATVTDSDSTNFNSGNVTVHISANGQSGEDVLGVDTSTVTLSSGTSVGSTVSVGGIAIGTIATNGDGVSGHDLIVTLNSNATASRVTTLVGALTYQDNASGIPNTSTRTIQVSVNDGHGGTSSAASVTMAVSAAPLVTASGGSAAFTAGDNTTSTPVAVDSGITVTDNASPTLASGSVSITGNFHSGEDVLTFTNDGSTMGNITASYNSGTGVLTLTSSGATATLAQWQAALRAVTYTDSAVTPNSATRTISFQVQDGSSNTSTVATRTVTVADTDQTPIASASGGSTAFTAGDNATSTPVTVDNGITLSDLDNTTLASATASITGNFHSGEDVLSFTNTSAITYGNIVASYNSGTGVLTLTSSGATATIAQWQAAMRAVKYTDSAVTPNTANRTISFVVNDGTKNSAATTKTVTVADTDQTPIVTTSGGSTAFSAGDNVTSTPVTVDSGLTVSDLDNTTLASATASITGNFHSSEDMLAFTNNGSTMGNIAASYNSGTGVLTLTSSGATATLAQWQAALRAVTYTDSAITPNTASRTISFSINDGSKDSTVATRTVTVTATDQTPIVTTTGGNGSYMLSGTPTPVVVDNAITLSDRDNTTLASGTVSITGNFHSSEDVLAFSNTNASLYGNITGSYNSGTGVLTLTSSGATATLAQWQSALRAVTYNDTSGSASTATRTISFVVNDGTANSSVATRGIAIQLPAPAVAGLTAGTDTGSSSVDGITGNNEPTVTGTAMASSTVTVYVDGVSVGTTTADGSGAWSYSFTSSLLDGSHAITATASSGGVNSSLSSAYSVQIDTSAPGVPTSLALTSATDTGSSHSDGITNNNTPMVQGSAEANSTVTVYVDGTAVGTATANGSGAWSYTLPSALADGSHSIRATATDTAGNSSAQASAYSITVDTAAPQLQSLTQLDPVSTSSSSARYDVVFSKAISGLTADAFSLVSSGSAHGVIASVTAISDTHYIVTLGSLGGDGSLALAVKQNGVSDVAGNTNAQQVVAQAYQLSSPVVTPPATPAPPTVIVPDSSTSTINVGTITPNIVLAAVSSPSHAGSTGSVVPTIMGDPGSMGPAPGQIPFGQDHFVPTSLEPFGTGRANPSFVANLTGSTGPVLQVMPDLGTQQLQAGQGFTFNLPRSTVITQGQDVVLNIQVRQSNGQPLPAWLKFDPQTGRFSGTPPAGWDKPLSLELTFRDQHGHRGVSHIKLQTRHGQQAATVQDKVAVAGKPALHEQFRQHGKLSFDEQLAQWLQQEDVV